uniref:HMG box domain-containing protein n=1 Tax=Panagrolaimus sp. ES5 TaxID=591445 RepID=A0AC34FGT9_9BILA
MDCTGTKTKRVKDPNAPKRAMSAFFFWMGENRDKLKKPGMSVADVAKAAGVEWRKLTDKTLKLANIVINKYNDNIQNFSCKLMVSALYNHFLLSP